MHTLQIRQDARQNGRYTIRLSLRRGGKPDQSAEANIEFALTEQEQEDLRWYLEDYLQRAATVEPVTVQQVESMLKTRGEELYQKVLAANGDTQALWFAIRDHLADLRVELTTGIAEAASIPWELMRDPAMDSPISLRVHAFVRVQSNPNISFVGIPPIEDGRIRLLYIACRPGGAGDVALRAVANTLLQGLGPDRARFDIKALRPPSFEQLQKELGDAKLAGRPYHIVHFDGHGVYADLIKTKLAEWAALLSTVMLAGKETGKHGYLLFEHQGAEKIRPVDGETLGKLLHDNGVPVLVLNACQSAMHQSAEAPQTAQGVHDEVRTIGSLSQAVIDQGIPAVLGMRYSVYVVTAAQYIGQLYAALARGGTFGRAATQGRQHLQLNPDRWLGLEPRPLQDWFVPVAYEAGPVELLSVGKAAALSAHSDLDPLESNRALLRYVPDKGFVGRDETLLELDRAFDSHRVALLHAYAGQGKSSTAVEFARWYATTGGLGEQPIVLLASFETHTDLNDLLNQIGQPFAPLLEQQGIHWSAINDTEQRRRLALQLLRFAPVLWIWDNIEPVAGFPEGTESQWTAGEQNDLRDFLKQIQLDNSSRVKILLTSRRDESKWLREIPHRIAMRPMNDADAASLALKLGEEKRLSPSEIAGWQPLLDYCAGNPLTLRVLVGQAVRESKRGGQQIADFVQAIRRGEQKIEDADERQGRDKSLGASLDYGFRHAFKDDELPIIALLHLFHGIVDVDALESMGRVGEHALPELHGKTGEQLAGLLERAAETGLLTHLFSTYFAIHPALPWFLGQLFEHHYDGQAGRSTAQLAIRAWAEAIGQLGDFYLSELRRGEGRASNFLAREEANLLHARRLARRRGWSSVVTSCMQGLGLIYDQQGRKAEWARLVEEIVPDYCTTENAPIAGREDDYSIVMGYRVNILKDDERDLAKAGALQQKVVELDRRQAAAVLALPEDMPLSEIQRHRLSRLGACVGTLGQIELEAGSPECVRHFEEARSVCRRAEDKPGEEITEFNLGHAYKDIAGIRDLDAAEAAFRRSLMLCAPNDALGRSKSLKEIASVHHLRFRDARALKEADDVLLRHLQEAENHLLDAMRLCPRDALPVLGNQHNLLGVVYQDAGNIRDAKLHYEKAAQYHEKEGDHHAAGSTRFNIALMYAKAAGREGASGRRADLLKSARAYAEAALRDFQYYQGRAAKDEADTGKLITLIDEWLANPPNKARISDSC